MPSKQVTKLKVVYETNNVVDKIDEAFDKAIGELAKSYGLTFVGSGYDLKKECRDLEFKINN